jgi:topoisomerase-4 subunit A
MDSRPAGSEEPLDQMGDMEGGDEEVEVTREELISALQEVVQNLSDGLRGADRDTYLAADDLAQNEWFFAGVSDEEGQYAITMWPAEGDEDMLRIDIGSEDDVHRLAADPEMLAAMTDDFIEAMDEDYEEYEEYDEDEDDLEDEEYEDEDVDDLEALDEADAADLEDAYEDEEDQNVRNDGNLPPR